MKKLVMLLVLWTSFYLSSQNLQNTGQLLIEPSPFEFASDLEADGSFVFGRIDVPQYAAEPTGPSLNLAVGIFKSRGNAVKDPLVLCAGGPGLSYLDDFVPGFAGELGDLFLNDRDVVIIESRGLKYSEPFLHIPGIEDLQLSILDQNLTADETIELYLKELDKAYKAFTAKGYDLSSMNPIEMTHEIAYVMSRLGYEKFSMFGSSYGTVLVQYMLLNYPDRVSSAVLNGSVNIHRSAYDMHRGTVEALEETFSAISGNPELKTAYPDLKNRFLEKISKLNKEPDTIILKYAPLDREYKVVLNGNRIALWLFHQLYSNTQLPRSLDKISRGNYEEVLKDPGLILPIPEFSTGLSLSSFLSGTPNPRPEDWFSGTEYEELIKGASLSMFGPYFYSKASIVWPVEARKQPEAVSTVVPLLLLGGKFDHLCRPSYAEKLASSQKESYLYLFDNVVHSPVDNGPCAILMLKEFLDDPSKAPNSDCMEAFVHEYKLPDL